MTRRAILDPTLKQKIASKLGKKDTKAVNNLVSKLAAKLSISAEAALIVLAKRYGIGTAIFQRRLDPTKQEEVRDALPSIFGEKAKVVRATKQKVPKKRPGGGGKREVLKSAVEYLMKDAELRERCEDILLARSKFDRPISQATLVLEDRIRKKAEPDKKLTGENLVGFAFNEEVSKTVLRVPGGDPEAQRGFTQILRGVFPAFRNKTHHSVTDTFSREDAMRVCGFIDVLLLVIDKSDKVK